MNGWVIGGVLATIIGAPVSVFSLFLFARGQARTQTEKRAIELQKNYDKGFRDGQANVAPDVNLARSERDEARHERDAHNRRADRAERRIEELEDQLRRAR